MWVLVRERWLLSKILMLTNQAPSHRGQRTEQETELIVLSHGRHKRARGSVKQE